MNFHEILDAWERRAPNQGPSADKDLEQIAPSTKRERERASVDAELDLHGLVVDEALHQMRMFLKHSRQVGRRKVLIIHGKGLHSESRKAVLREAVRQALLKDRNVASWGEADRKDGGKGASWVWLQGS